MSPNLNRPAADALVDELARLTGESKTQAVIAVLRERLDRAQRECDRHSLSQDIQAIGKRRAARGRANALDPWRILLRRGRAASMIIDTSAVLAWLRRPVVGAMANAPASWKALRLRQRRRHGALEGPTPNSTLEPGSNMKGLVA